MAINKEISLKELKEKIKTIIETEIRDKEKNYIEFSFKGYSSFDIVYMKPISTIIQLVKRFEFYQNAINKIIESVTD